MGMTIARLVGQYLWRRKRDKYNELTFAERREAGKIKISEDKNITAEMQTD